MYIRSSRRINLISIISCFFCNWINCPCTRRCNSYIINSICGFTRPIKKIRIISIIDYSWMFLMSICGCCSCKSFNSPRIVAKCSMNIDIIVTNIISFPSNTNSICRINCYRRILITIRSICFGNYCSRTPPTIPSIS